MQRQHIDFSLVLFQPEITVHADEKLLSQVLINLLKNAMQALEGQADGKIRMEVDTEKNQLLIRVTDNGPGVPSDLIEDIFVPFFTTKATGSGIGLRSYGCMEENCRWLRYLTGKPASRFLYL